MLRHFRIAALAMAVTIAFSGLALAQRDDDDHGGDRDRHGHWRDGDHDRDDRGRRDRDRDRDRDHDRDRDRDREWRHNQGWGRWGDRRGDGDADDHWYRGGNSPVYGRNYPGSYGNRGYGASGYNQGYRDGALTAQSDAREHKPYNPSPRGRYSDGYHGYVRGDINSYRQSYYQGYAQGYRSAYGGGRWGY